MRIAQQHGGDKAVEGIILRGSREDVQKILTAVKDTPEMLSTIRRSFIEDGLIRAGVKQAGTETVETPFNVKKFRDHVFGLSEVTQNKADLLLPARNQAKIGEFLNAVSDQQAAAKTGKTGAVLVAMKQSQAIFTIPKGAIEGTGAVLGGFAIGQAGQGDIAEAGLELTAAGSIIMGPKWIAQALTDPRKTEMLIQGLRYSLVNESQSLRVTRELMRMDQIFARAVQLAGTQFSPERHVVMPEQPSGAAPQRAFPLQR